MDPRRQHPGCFQAFWERRKIPEDPRTVGHRPWAFAEEPCSVGEQAPAGEGEQPAGPGAARQPTNVGLSIFPRISESRCDDWRLQVLTRQGVGFDFGSNTEFINKRRKIKFRFP